MASCSRALRKPNSAEEERNLTQNAILKSTRAVTKWSAVGKTKIQQSSLKCIAWTLI